MVLVGNGAAVGLMVVKVRGIGDQAMEVRVGQTKAAIRRLALKFPRISATLSDSIRLNAVRAGLLEPAEDLCDYDWSS